MRLTLILATALSLVSAAALAQQNQQPNRAAMRAVIDEMGVSPREMRSCGRTLRETLPQPAEGQTPTEAQRTAARDAMYACLADKNSELTRDTFDSAMAKIPRR